MPIHNDIERAARDPNYRILYEGERMRETNNAIQRKRFPPEQKKKKPKDEESKVICTELHRQGLLGRDDYMLGLRYVREHLTADAHTASTAKVQKKIIADCLAGEREAQVEKMAAALYGFSCTARFPFRAARCLATEDPVGKEEGVVEDADAAYCPPTETAARHSRAALLLEQASHLRNSLISPLSDEASLAVSPECRAARRACFSA